MPSPEKIAGKFVEECERVLNKKLVYTFFGSVRFKKYVEKKSDIDIILLAERVFILPKDNRSDESLWEKILESQEEEKNGLGNRCHDNPLS